MSDGNILFSLFSFFVAGVGLGLWFGRRERARVFILDAEVRSLRAWQATAVKLLAQSRAYIEAAPLKDPADLARKMAAARGEKN